MLDRHVNSPRRLVHSKKNPSGLPLKEVKNIQVSIQVRDGSVIVLHNADVLFFHFGFQAEKSRVLFFPRSAKLYRRQNGTGTQTTGLLSNSRHTVGCAD